MEKTFNQRLDSLKNIVAIQCTDGTWNFNPYMMGMANGLMIALACFTDESPEFKETPEGGWLEEKVDRNAIREGHREALSEPAIPGDIAIAELKERIATKRAAKGGEG